MKQKIVEVTSPPPTRIAANFEHNLESIELFLHEANAPQAFDALLDELHDVVIPNLERFPRIGRQFLGRPIRSVEASNSARQVAAALKALAGDGELREYVMSNYLLLYANLGATLCLLSIRHHKQLSFDLHSLWPATFD